jgi:alpha-tubulin suppressor-like RCC1 family protein
MNFLFYALFLILAQGSDEVWCNNESFRPAVDHTCAIDNHFHHVHCWGAMANSFEFAPPADIEFVKISGIYQTGCGLSKEGRVYLWGKDHSKVISKTPMDAGFIDVSCGVHHACGVKEDKSVECWGLSSDNRLNVPANKQFKQIECANEHTCGLTVSNTIECWGHPNENRLAKPDGEFLSIRCGSAHCYGIKKSDEKEMIGWGYNAHGQINTPDGWKSPKQFDLGYHFSCALNQSNKLKCWGHNEKNVIGIANTKADVEYKDVKCGHTHLCVLTMDDEWECWGEAAETNNMPLFYDWVNIDDCGTKVVDVSSWENTFSCAHETGCALDESHHVHCWGTGTMNVAPPTVRMQTIESIYNVYCGLTMENGVKCWGIDNSGVISDAPTRTDLISVTPGYDFGCATTKDYLVVCWGKHGDNREAVPLHQFYKTVQNGMYTTCGITFTGKIECWGHNGHGLLSHPVDDTKQYVELRCVYACCALDENRSVVCWGYNSHGEVSKAPTSLKNIKQLSAGVHHFCVLKEDDSIQCWGRNSKGESSNPSGNDWLALGDMGIHESCAMNKQHKIICWGHNNKQQLNVPTGKNWLAPTNIEAPMRTWVEVGPGSCPEVDQTGRQKGEFSTVKECRDRCFDTYSETYFTMTTNSDGTILCTCFKDCDTLTNENNVFAYEVLSNHVGEEFQIERQLMIDYRTRFGKALEKTSFLENKLTTMNTELVTKTKNLVDMTAQKRMFEERFKHIQANEPLSGKAADEYPDPIYDVSVGSSKLQEPTSARVFNWLTLVVAFGAGICAGGWFTTQKKMQGELESLL